MNYRKTLLIALLLTALIPSLAFCLPQGEEIAAGGVSLDRSTADTLNIGVSTDKAIINWHGGFDTKANEAVNFAGGQSVLNRVTSGSPTEFLGTLTSTTAQIFVINPNGVVFGQGSRLDVPALVASTLDITNDDFLAGKYNFFKNGENAFVINEGNINIKNGGYVCLLSQAVENRGVIVANLGTVVMAAGEKMTVMGLDDANQISVAIDEAVKEGVFGPNGQKMDSAVKNSGTIIAAGGKVILTAKLLNKVFDYAINNQGVIQANNIVNHNGVIELVAEGAPVINTGTLEAGYIKVSVPQGDFINKGTIKADGVSGLPNGGKVIVNAGTILQQGLVSANSLEGGDAGEVELVSETSTTLDENSQTQARAMGIVGNGGRILVNSTRGNTFVKKNAVLDVSAGNNAGNAGFMEISAYKQLGFFGILSGRAPPGFKGATVLFDPYDIIIQTGGTSHEGDLNDTLIFDPAYLAGLGVAEIWLQATHDITLQNNLSLTGKSIKLEADNDININANLSAQGGITLTADANNDGVGTLNIATGITVQNSVSGDINLSGAIVKLLNSTGKINNSVGNLTITGKPVNASDVNSIQTVINAVGTVSGAITINVSAGTYVENVVINKKLTLIGTDGASNTKIVATNANATPLTFSTNDATVQGFTLTHEYTAAELAAWNFNNNGVTIASRTGNTLTECIVTLNRNGIYLNNAQNNKIINNTIINNRTGINMTGNINGTQITGNTISNNWTEGIVFYQGSGISDLSTVVVEGNTFDQNWYVEILIKDASACSGTLDVTSNTFTDTAVTYTTSTDASLNEPAYADLIPVELGGTATKPAKDLPTLRIYNSGAVVLKYDLKTLNVGADEPYKTIQSAINDASAGDTINVVAGTYDVTTTIIVDRGVIITGPESGVAKVQGTSLDAVTVFSITSSDVTIQNLEITVSEIFAGYPSATATDSESLTALIRVAGGLGYTGIVIKNNTIYVPLQSGSMSGWVARAITVKSDSAAGINITGNTIYNTRNGIVIQYRNTATITDNVIFNTKGGIMNYTSSQDDAGYRTVTGNSWGSTVSGIMDHSEWDIVWNTAYYVPDYQASVLTMSSDNNGAYVVDRRAENAAACAALTGNRSHVFVDASGSGTAGPTGGSVTQPYSSIEMALDAVIESGTVKVNGGTYSEDVNINKPLTLLLDGSLTVNSLYNNSGTITSLDDIDITSTGDITIYNGSVTTATGSITLKSLEGDITITDSYIYSDVEVDEYSEPSVAATSGNIALEALIGSISSSNSQIYSYAYAYNEAEDSTATAVSGDVTLTAGGTIDIVGEDITCVYSKAKAEADSSASATSGEVKLDAGADPSEDDISITVDADSVYSDAYAYIWSGDMDSSTEATSKSVTLVADEGIEIKNNSYVYSRAQAYYGDTSTAESGNVELDAEGNIRVDNSYVYSSAVAEGNSEAHAYYGNLELSAGDNSADPVVVSDISLNSANLFIGSYAYADIAEAIAAGEEGSITLDATGEVILDSSNVNSGYDYDGEYYQEVNAEAEGGSFAKAVSPSIILKSTNASVIITNSNIYTYAYASRYYGPDTSSVSQAGDITINAENGDITVGGSYIESCANAYGFSADETSATAGSVTFTAGEDVEVKEGSTVSTQVEAQAYDTEVYNIQAGDITLTADGYIFLEGGNINSGADLIISGMPVNEDGDPSIQALIEAISDSFAGSCTLKIAGGTYSADSEIDLNQSYLTLQLLGDITLGGSLNISDESATLDANNYNITLPGNWTNFGTFIAGIGTVTLNGTEGQSITTGGSDSAFNILTVSNTSAEGITFEDALYAAILNAGSGVKKLNFATGTDVVHTISAEFNVNGSEENLIELAPKEDDTIWNLDAPASTVSYVSVGYSNANGGVITAKNSVNGGNNTNWAITGAASSFEISDVTSPITAGGSTGITVTVKDAYGNTIIDYTGTVQFTSTDSQAVLPDEYTFVAADNGAKTFADGITLNTVGAQTVTVTDTATDTITGNHSITVNAAPATDTNTVDTIISADINAVIRFVMPDSQQLGESQFSPFFTMGPVYFYHPLTLTEMSGFNEFILEAGAYEFIDGQIRLNGHAGLLPYLQ